MLLTAKDLVFNKPKDKNQSFSTIPLNQISPLVISKQDVNQLVNYINNKLIKRFYFIYFLLAFLFISLSVLFSILITLPYLFLASFINFLLYRLIFKKKVHFKKIFQIGLHAITLPLLLDYFLIIIQPFIKLKLVLPFSQILFFISFFILICAFIFDGISHAYYSKT